MNTSNRFSSATQQKPLACVSTIEGAKLWASQLVDAFDTVTSLDGTTIAGIESCTGLVEIECRSDDDNKHFIRVEVHTGDTTTESLRLTRHHASWLARALVDSIAYSLVATKPAQATYVPAAPTTGAPHGLPAGESYSSTSTTERLTQALQALADHTQRLLANPANLDSQATAQICIYAARNALDLTALEQANAEREARHAAERATGHEYHGVRA